MSAPTHKGNALLIIIIVAVVALIVAGLAFVFWKQITGGSTATSTVSTYEECTKQSGSMIRETYPEQCVTTDGKTFTAPVTAEETQVEKLTYCAPGEKLCFDYPKDWTIEQLDPIGTDPGFEGDRFTVSDPTLSMQLWFTSGIGGIGGVGEPDGTMTTVLQGVPVAKMSGFKTDYEKSVDQPSVARVVVQEQDKFRTYLYVSNVSDYVNEGEIEGIGGVFPSDILVGKNARISSDYDGYGAFSFNNGSAFGSFNSYSLYDTRKDAIAAFDTKLFVEATNILASLRYS